MKNMNKTLVIFLFFFSLIACREPKIKVEIPKYLIETKKPESPNREWYELATHNHKIKVKIIDYKLNIKKTNSLSKEELEKGNKAVLKLGDGNLIGVDRGEVGWDGKLSFVFNDKNKEEIEIKKGNIKFIFKFQGKIYFIEGRTPYAFSFGGIFELKRNGKKFSYKKVVDFEEEPEAFTIHKDKLLVATDYNFYIVKDFKAEPIFESVFWANMWPNSIAVVDDKNVYMGIRSGLVKLDLIDKKIIFYKVTE